MISTSINSTGFLVYQSLEQQSSELNESKESDDYIEMLESNESEKLSHSIEQLIASDSKESVVSNPVCPLQSMKLPGRQGEPVKG